MNYRSLAIGRGVGGPAEKLFGEYSIGYAAGWACPLCRSRERGWSCDCRQRPDLFHCGGRQGRRTYRACGRLETRGFIEVESIAVRGEFVGRRPAGGRNIFLIVARPPRIAGKEMSYG